MERAKKFSEKSQLMRFHEAFYFTNPGYWEIWAQTKRFFFLRLRCTSVFCASWTLHQTNKKKHEKTASHRVLYGYYVVGGSFVITLYYINIHHRWMKIALHFKGIHFPCSLFILWLFSISVEVYTLYVSFSLYWKSLAFGRMWRKNWQKYWIWLEIEGNGMKDIQSYRIRHPKKKSIEDESRNKSQYTWRKMRYLSKKSLSVSFDL